MIQWGDPMVQSAIIQAFSVVVAAIVAGIIGKQFISRRLLQEKLILAQQDVAFLLQVEEAHCEVHQQNSGKTLKNRMRDIARQKGLVWSGQFTPGRANHSPTLRAAKLATT